MAKKKQYRQSPDNFRKTKKLLIATSIVLLFMIIALVASQGTIQRLLTRVTFDVNIPASLDDSGLWGPRLNHERLLLRLETNLFNGQWDESSDNGPGEADGLMNERWLDLGPASFYIADTVQLHAEYHSILLLYAAETADRALFNFVYEILLQQFVRDDGLLRTATSPAPVNPSRNLQDATRPSGSESYERSLLEDKTVWRPTEEMDAIDYYATLIYMRSLALSYTHWGSDEHLRSLETASDAYLAASLDSLPPLDGTELLITPTPPTFVDEAGNASDNGSDNRAADDGSNNVEEESTRLDFIRLSSIDLETLRVLSSLDSAYEAIYENTVDLLKNAQRENQAVFSEAYDPESESYIHYVDTANIHLGEQLKIMNSLAEIGELNDSARAWLRSRLNNRELVETYTLQDVTTSSTMLYPLRYAQVCRIARHVEDFDLYGMALDQLLENNISTVIQSPLYGSIFRGSVSGDVVQVTLADNVWALFGAR